MRAGLLAVATAVLVAMACSLPVKFEYSLPVGFSGAVAIFRSETGTNAGVIPADGLLIQRGEPFRNAEVRVAWRGGSTSVYEKDLQAFQGTTQSGCKYSGVSFYVGGAKPHERHQRVRSIIKRGVAQVCL